MSERNTSFLLQDNIEAIQNILAFTKGFSYDCYCTDIKTKHAAEHNFMIIGEAVSRIPDAYKLHHNIINWRQLKDFRNVIVHDYFGIDDSIVWDIIQLSLPDLSQQISTCCNKRNLN